MKNIYTLLLILTLQITSGQAPILNTPENGATINGISTPLDWFDVVGESGYIYQIDITDTFDSPRVVTLTIGAFSGSGYPTIYLSNLSFGTTYYWRVATQNGTSQSVWSETRNFITIAQPTLQFPENNSIIDNVTANLTWNDVDGETGYIYQYDTADTFDSTNLITQTIGEHNSGTSLPDVIIENLVPETTYYWRVAILNNTRQSSWSETWAFTTGNTAHNNNNIANVFTVYPNPVKDILHFSNVPNDSNITINSIDGKVILSGKANDNSPLNLDNLPTGLYLITIEKDDQKAVKKFIKQ